MKSATKFTTKSLLNLPVPTGLCFAAALTLGAATAVPAFAQSNQDQANSGQAQIRQRTGPSVTVEPGQSPHIVVMFTGEEQSSSAYGRGSQEGAVQIVLLDQPAPEENSGDQSSAPRRQEDEREIVFSSDNALNGIVTFNFGDSGNRYNRSDQDARTLTFMAKTNGQPMEIEQVVQRDNVYVLTVRQAEQPQQQQTAQADQQSQQAQQQNSGRGQAQVNRPGQTAQADQQSGQQTSQESQQEAQTAAARQEAAQQQRRQQRQQRLEQQRQQQQEQQEQNQAVIFIYLGGSSQQ